MKQRLGFHRLVSAFLWVVPALVVSTQWIGHAQQTAPGTGDDPHFTGKSTTMEATGLSVSRRHFEAGARTAWHRHPHGQLLLVEEGRARIQQRGQPMKELGQGESEYTPPNVDHWHGAVPGQPAVQLFLQFGGETKWMDKVTDEEYGGRGK